jgi:hypothetical protein
MNNSACDIFSYQRKKRSGSGNDNLPDPFVSYSNVAYPSNLVDVFRLCEYMWLNSGQFKMAMQRIIRYFLTKVEFGGDTISDSEKKRYREFLVDQLGIMDLAALVGDDFICYGNSASTLYLPFNRILTCTKCKLSRNIDNVKDVTIDLKKLIFSCHCPRCKSKTDHSHKDLRSMDENRIHLVRLNVHEINLTHSFLSGDTDMYWQISPMMKDQAQKSQSLFLQKTPWEVIEAISKNSLLKFNKDVVYHFKEETICGVQNRGWGIPRMLPLFKDIYRLQLLKRYDEAIAMDYIVPFRLLTPKAKGKIDPLMQYDMSNWSSQILGMISDHRRDPAGWHTVPFPVEYQALGAEGLQFSPVQLVKQGNTDLMDAAGIPIDLFQGNLSLQSAPTALRLFQATWPQLVSQLNGWLQWIMDKTSDSFGWENAKVKLQPVTYADDLDRKGMLLQLATAQQVSKETAFASIGIEPREEQRRMLEETKHQVEAQREFEENEMKKQEMQDVVSSMSMPPQQMMGGGGGMMPPNGMMQGGMPQPMGGMPGMSMPGQQPGVPMSPQMLLNQAQELAQQLLSMDETTRRSQLIQLKQSNPTLHAQVKQIMEDMSQDASTQGVAAMRQQMQGAGGMM